MGRSATRCAAADLDSSAYSVAYVAGYAPLSALRRVEPFQRRPQGGLVPDLLARGPSQDVAASTKWLVEC